MPPKALRAPAGATPARKRDWGHPEGIPLWEVEVDAFYDGRVTNVGQYGVFIDFGAVKDGRLNVPRDVGRGYRRGMELHYLKVISVDPDQERVELEPPEDSLPEPPPRRPAGARAKSAGTAGIRRQSRPRRNWDHSEATPLEDLREGDVFEGTVTNVSKSGVFVDIGAVRDARLNVPRVIGERFRIGDVVEDCMVENINLETQRMGVSLRDPEEAVRDLPPKERRPRSASRARQPKARAQPQQRPESDLLRIEDLEEGSLCDGVVSANNQRGIFVSIGCDKDARLTVPNRLRSRFSRGDEIYGMRIDKVDLERNEIKVSLDPEEEGEGDDEVWEEPPAQAARPATAPSAAKRAASGAPTKAAPKPPKSRAPAPKAAAPKAAAPKAAAPKAAAPKAAAPKAAAPKATTRRAPVEHPAGKPISRYRVGSTVNGIVSRIGPQGVYVDVGAMMDGLLKLPRAVANQFLADDEVHGMTVEDVDNEANRLILSLDDPELEEPPPPAPAPRAAAPRQEKAKSRAADEQPKTGPRAQATNGNDWSHPGALSLEELEPGSEVSGVVTNLGNFGAFVDIGAVRDARLRLSRREQRRFTKGDEVNGLVVEDVDAETETIWLRFIDMTEETSPDDHRPTAVADPPVGPSSRSTTAKNSSKKAAANTAPPASALRSASKRTTPK